MANEQGQSDRDRERPQVTPSGSEEDLFGVPFVPAPGPEDIFAALGASASSMARPDVFPFGRGAGAEPPSRLPLGALTQNLLAFRGFGPLSRVQKLLVGGIVAIAIALLWVLAVKPPAAEHVTRDPSLVEDVARLSAPVGGAVTREGPPARDTAFGEEPPSRTSAPGAPAPVPSPVGREGRTLPGPEPLSLQLADKLYLRRDFEPARTMYEKLHRRLPATEDNQALRDFLLLRMALCLKNSGPAAEAGGTSASLPEGMGDADGLLRAVSLSRWPILRALARYHQSVILLDRRRYLEAATRAYQTLALIEVANYDKKWVAAVQQQCGFLAAEAMTRHVLSLCDADVNLPAALWSGHPDLDPFVEIDEPQLRAFLAAGAEGLEGTVLGPQIRRSGDQPGAPRWSVLCNGAPLEELLARFAANAGVSLHWTDTAPAATDDNLRARPVYLYLTSATAAQVTMLAAGSVGLIAQAVTRDPSPVPRVTDHESHSMTVQLLDPTSYSSLTEHTRLLADETIALWQRFLLGGQDDPRAANAQFAIALLQTARGQFDEAIAQHKLLAGRFAKHALAPHALLRSGTLKVRLRDYTGAHADLKQLVEVYPDSELADRACLHLADATMKAGLYDEAAGLYRKVYNLGLSAASQTESAQGAGRCFYETGQYEEAAQWLNRYVTLARDQSRPGFSSACLLLGKAYLALQKPQQAQAALNLAIRGELSRQQHVETIVVLVRTYLEQGFFLEALDTLEGASGWQLSQPEAVELALLRGRTLRAIGLTPKATALMEGKNRQLASPDLQGKVALELARCYREDGRLELARNTLGEAFRTVEPGPLACQIGQELAGICLLLGQTAQAVSLCSQLLEGLRDLTPVAERGDPWPAARDPGNEPRVTSPASRATGPTLAWAATERQSILTLMADAYRRQGKYDHAVAALLDGYEGSELIKDN